MPPFLFPGFRKKNRQAGQCLMNIEIDVLRQCKEQCKKRRKRSRQRKNVQVEPTAAQRKRPRRYHKAFSRPEESEYWSADRSAKRPVLVGDEIDWLLLATFSAMKTLVGGVLREEFDAIGIFDELGFSLRLNYHPNLWVSERL